MREWLVLDVGNTHTVAGIYEIDSNKNHPHRLIARARFRTDPHTTADEYRVELNQLLPISNLKNFERLIISSVVPALEDIIQEVCRGFSPALPCLFIRHDTRRKFDLDLPFPNQLGADRLANVAGALALAPPPFLIIDAGTATTFCLIDDRPAYIGGAIVPGLEISWKALQSRAAKLFSVELHRPVSSIGKTTETQIQSGVIQGYETLIEAMTDRLLRDWKNDLSKKGLPFKEPTLLVTGGCIHLLQLSDRFRIEPDLTLLGLIQYGLITE